MCDDGGLHSHVADDAVDSYNHARLRPNVMMVGEGTYARVDACVDLSSRSFHARKRSRNPQRMTGLHSAGVLEARLMSELGSYAAVDARACTHLPMCDRIYTHKERTVIESQPLGQTDLQRVMDAVVAHAALTQERGATTTLPPAPITPLFIRTVLACVLHACSMLHKHGWMHRDVKPFNVLLGCVQPCNHTRNAAVAGDGLLPHMCACVTVIDFGMASRISADVAAVDTASIAGLPPTVEDDMSSRWRGDMYPCVCTISHRAPELLMGARVHSDVIDSWSVGIMGLELINAMRSPSDGSAIPGRSELDALAMITQLFGWGESPEETTTAASKHDRVYPDARVHSGYIPFHATCGCTRDAPLPQELEHLRGMTCAADAGVPLVHTAGLKRVWEWTAANRDDLPLLQTCLHLAAINGRSRMRCVDAYAALCASAVSDTCSQAAAAVEAVVAWYRQHGAAAVSSLATQREHEARGAREASNSEHVSYHVQRMYEEADEEAGYELGPAPSLVRILALE